MDPFSAESAPAVVAADDSLLVVRKPPRMHTAPGRSGEDLCSWVFARFPDAAAAGRGSGRPEVEGGLLHRLDYETSGLVLFARTPEAFAFLLAEQEEGRLRKEYLARAFPSTSLQPAGSRPLSSSPLGIGAEDWSEARAALDARKLVALVRAASGPRVDSAFRPYGPCAARVACLAPPVAEAPIYATAILECGEEGGGLDLLAGIEKGFRHQIRAHLAWIGVPIQGDPLYGDSPANRLYLHAARLRFVHPGTGRSTTIE